MALKGGHTCWSPTWLLGVGIVLSLTGLLAFGAGRSVKAAAGINHQISFQGKVVNSNGTNVANNSYTFVFSIYSVASAGTAIWTETKSLTVTDGVFQTNLGSVTSLPGSVDFNSDSLYLGVEFNSDGEMSPRVRLTAVPYAFNSDMVGGVPAADFLRSTASDTFEGINSRTLTIQSDLTSGNRTANLLNITQANDTSYNMTSGALLSIANSDTGSAANLLSLSNSGSGAALLFAEGTTVTNGIQWGTDTDLYRSAANTLKTDDAFVATDTLTVLGATRGVLVLQGNYNGATNVGHIQFMNDTTAVADYYGYSTGTGASASGSLFFRTNNAGTLTQALKIDQDQVLWIGSTIDTNLYRSTNNTLKTDDSFVVGGASLNLLTQASLRYYDADSSNYVAFQAPATVASNITWTLPSTDTSGCLSSNGSATLSWASCGGAGGAPTGAQYITLALDGTLTAERVLTGTANQITLTDGGADGNLTLSTPQDIHTSAKPQFSSIGLGTVASDRILMYGVNNSFNTANYVYGLATDVANLGSGPVYGVQSVARATATGTGDLIGVYALAVKASSVAATLTNVVGVRAGATIGTTGSISTVKLVDVVNPSYSAAGLVGNTYGVYVADITGTGATSQYGIAIAGADTQALWVGSGADNTDAANGIAFGSSRDTNLYRSAANVLKTDSNLYSGGSMQAYGGTVAAINSTSIDGDYVEMKALSEDKVILMAGDSGKYLPVYLNTSLTGTASTSGLGLGIPTSTTLTASTLHLASGYKVVWDDGAGTADVNLYRSSADLLKTDDTFQSSALIPSGTAVALHNSSWSSNIYSIPNGSLIDWASDGSYYRGFGATTSKFTWQSTNDVPTTTELMALVTSGTNIGQLQVPVSGGNAGLLLGGDVKLYRPSTNTLRTDNLTLFGAVNGAAASASAITLSGTLGIMDGSDTFRGIYLAYTNSAHTGASNVVTGIDIANITGQSTATETAIKVGTGWDSGLTTASPVSATYINAASGGGNAISLTGTLGIFNGSDTFNGINIGYTNANHTGSSNAFNAVNVGNITGDAEAVESALKVGTGWDYGVQLSLGGTAAIYLSDTGGTAASGILMGTDTNLYRGAANELRTDDLLSFGSTKTNTTIDFKTYKSDGGMAFIFDTSSAYSTGSLMSVRNNGTAKFMIGATGNVVISGTLTQSGVPADLSENIQVDDESIGAGEILAADGGAAETARRATAQDQRVLGIVSTEPGILISGGTHGKPLALSGRVPVKVKSDASIKIGDTVIVSDVAGVGTKGTDQIAPMVGVALSDQDAANLVTVQLQFGLYLPMFGNSLANSALSPQYQSTLDAFTMLNDNVLHVADLSVERLQVASLTVDGQIVADSLALSNRSAGRAVIVAGQTQVFVPTDLVESTDQILLTPVEPETDSPAAVNLYRGAVEPHQGFWVKLVPSQTLSYDQPFDWLVIK